MTSVIIDVPWIWEPMIFHAYRGENMTVYSHVATQSQRVSLEYSTLRSWETYFVAGYFSRPQLVEEGYLLNVFRVAFFTVQRGVDPLSICASGATALLLRSLRLVHSAMLITVSVLFTSGVKICIYSDLRCLGNPHVLVGVRFHQG